MITRDDVLSQAVDACMKELYSFACPSVKWKDFLKENKVYIKCYNEWETYNRAYQDRENNPEKWENFKTLYEIFDWKNKSITECIGPRPYEFYYLPKEIMKDVCDSYIHAYKIDSQQELLNTIQILKNYCKEPIVDKYIDDYTDEYGNHHPGYRSYDHPNNLEKELYDLIPDTGFDKSEIAKELQDKFFEFLDMAGNFYNWNRDLTSFGASVYLGGSPNSNKEAVIENWKKYRSKDITIDEEQIKRDYYGDDELD